MHRIGLMFEFQGIMASTEGHNLTQIAALLGVSKRTLHDLSCQSYGISPGRYIRNTRLCRARHALESGTSVTVSATQNGFFNLGRFAAAYRTLFGEVPSTTLRASKLARFTSRETSATAKNDLRMLGE